MKIMPYLNEILKTLMDIVTSTNMSSSDESVVKGQAIMCAG